MLHFIIAVVVGVLLVGLAFTLAMVWAPKGWRTVVTNSLAGIPIIGSIAIDITDKLVGVDLSTYIDNVTLAKTVALGLLIANVFLRAVTDTALGKSEPPKA